MNVKVRDGLVIMEMRLKMLNKVMGSDSKKEKTLVFCFDSVVSLIHEGCCCLVRRQQDNL